MLVAYVGVSPSPVEILCDSNFGYHKIMGPPSQDHWKGSWEPCSSAVFCHWPNNPWNVELSMPYLFDHTAFYLNLGLVVQFQLSAELSAALHLGMVPFHLVAGLSTALHLGLVVQVQL